MRLNLTSSILRSLMYGWHYWRQCLDVPISSNDNYFMFLTNIILSSLTWISFLDYAAMFNDCARSPSKIFLFMRDLNQGNDNMIITMFSKAGIILKHVEDKGVMSFLLLHRPTLHFFFLHVKIMKLYSIWSENKCMWLSAHNMPHLWTVRC